MNFRTNKILLRNLNSSYMILHSFYSINLDNMNWHLACFLTSITCPYIVYLEISYIFENSKDIYYILFFFFFLFSLYFLFFRSLFRFKVNSIYCVLFVILTLDLWLFFAASLVIVVHGQSSSSITNFEWTSKIKSRILN